MRLRNRCCKGRSMIIIYSECVFVALVVVLTEIYVIKYLVIEHAMRMQQSKPPTKGGST